MSQQASLRTTSNLIQRLELAFDWYRGMVSTDTGLLVHTYDPETNKTAGRGSAIRDIASVWDVEVLSDFLGHRRDVAALVERSLEYYSRFLVPREGSLHFDSELLGEPASIAHSAFMLLALLDAAEVRISGHDEKAVQVAQGISSQQRRDGSYRVFFDVRADEGLEFYPGEAMLGLMKAYQVFRDERHLASVEYGFAYYQHRFPVNGLASHLRVFYANWQSQYAALLHGTTHSESLRGQVRDYIFQLHDRIISDGFYERVGRFPEDQATVEVACGLEGLNDAYAIAGREKDSARSDSYARCIRIALDWLLRAQRLEDCTERERGGFGHSLTDRTQRIDVTGHAVSGLIKATQNGITM